MQLLVAQTERLVNAGKLDMLLTLLQSETVTLVYAANVAPNMKLSDMLFVTAAALHAYVYATQREPTGGVDRVDSAYDLLFRYAAAFW